MTDRELMELAAKAAGIALENVPMMGAGLLLEKGGVWNPIADDGDALRLAVRLEIRIDWGAFDVVAIEFNTDAVAREKKALDPYAATRRAITRAAAEIGRGMT
jgi:hypothetical protein